MKHLTKYLILWAVLGLAACASPAAQMTPEQISSLSNQQLCNLKNNYLWDQNTEVEIGRRNLNCDPVYNECVQRGAESGPELSLCMNQIRDKQVMEQKIAQQEAELEAQRSRNELLMRSQGQQSQNPASPFCPTFPYCAK